MEVKITPEFVKALTVFVRAATWFLVVWALLR